MIRSQEIVIDIRWIYDLSIVYSTKVNNIHYPREIIKNELETICRISGLFDGVRNSILRHIVRRVEAQGRHFEHFLQLQSVL